MPLESFHKKLTIIDFWASWCKPCRAENPNLIALYEKFKKQGLEIVSISIDKAADRDKWLEAIVEDGLTWPQLWDSQSEVNKSYGVTAIHGTFIIDSEGVIVPKDQRGEKLNQFVEETFKSN